MIYDRLLHYLVPLAFYMALATYVSYWAGQTWPAGLFLLFYLLLFLGLDQALQKKHKKIARALPAVSLLALPLSQSLFWILPWLPPALALLRLSLKGPEPLSYAFEKNRFLNFLKGSPLFLLPLFFSLSLTPLVQGPLPWLALSWMASILLLRSLRHQNALFQQKRRPWIDGALALLGLTLLFELSQNVLSQRLSQGLAFFYQGLFRPLLMGAGYLMSWGFYGLALLLARLKKESPQTPAPEWGAQVPTETLVLDLDQLDWPWGLKAALALLGLALLLLVLYLWWRHQGQNNPEAPQVELVEIREALPDTKKDPGTGLGLMAPQEPGLAVRYYYRKLLVHARSRQLDLPASATSQDILLTLAPHYDPELLDTFSQLYRLARYSPHPLGETQRRQAKDLYRLLKRSGSSK